MPRIQTDPAFLAALRWGPDGLIPAIVQDVESMDVLMMAWMNFDALRKTLEHGETYFYSRSRQSLWHKGGTSGHTQTVESLHVDCDGDVLLIRVRQRGGACHEGYRTCFFRRVGKTGDLEVTQEPVFDQAAVYRSHDGK